MLLVGRLVERVVSCYPGVVFIVLGEVLPDLDCAVLEVFVNPDYVLATQQTCDLQRA